MTVDTRVRLRAAGLIEADVLALLHAACFEDAWSPQSMREVLGSPAVSAWIALADGPDGEEPAGLAVARLAADESELLSIAVAPPYRRHGVASRLIDEVIRHAAAAGARRLFLEVAEDNLGAQALYARFGFVTVGRRPGYYQLPSRPPVAALTMRRFLAARWWGRSVG